MKLIDELFLNYFPIYDELLKYGFFAEQNVYSYKRNILNDDFEIIVTIKDGQISAKIIDKEFGDEYIGLNIKDGVGSFLGEMKDACSEVLLDIRNHCFKRDFFAFPQANRITYHNIEKYKAEPEFLWDDTPDCGVFRNKDSKKWFGIIMHVKRDRLINNAEGFVDVMNIKLDDKVEECIRINGIYPAYHMNKKYWVSIILDDTLSDELIFDLIDISFKLSNK